MTKVSEMPDVLDWVTSFGVVVEGRSREFFREFTLQNGFRERGIGDLDNGLFRSAIELQLTFLDPSLDQLVEGLNVGELFYPPPSLVVLNSHSKTR